MDKIVVIEGQVQILHALDGDMQLSGSMDGEAGTVIEVSRETHDTYDGPYEVTPSTLQEQTLETRDKILEEDVLVKKIPYWETSNEHGLTVYIGNDTEV